MKRHSAPASGPFSGSALCRLFWEAGIGSLIKPVLFREPHAVAEPRDQG